MPRTIAKNPDDQKYFDFLDNLRESGATNMFGAGRYLDESFPELGWGRRFHSSQKAQEILYRWMQEFGSDSGQLISFALPMAVAAIAMYLMHFMAAHGILQSLTMIGGK